MTAVTHGARTGLQQVGTGVARLPGLSLEPVVIASDATGTDPALLIALPLLSRRRDVYITSDCPADLLPSRFALIVAPGCVTPLASDARLSALILLDPAVTMPHAACPVLLIVSYAPPAIAAGTHNVRCAQASHPAEQAHLIDAFLRDPCRHPAGSTIPRARP